MLAPTALISIRLSEEQIMSLDQRVGTDGFRNRSDVVRESVRRFLATTDISSHTVELKIGADLSRTLNRFCALRGKILQVSCNQGPDYTCRRRLKRLTISTGLLKPDSKTSQVTRMMIR